MQRGDRHFGKSEFLTIVGKFHHLVSRGNFRSFVGNFIVKNSDHPLKKFVSAYKGSTPPTNIKLQQIFHAEVFKCFHPSSLSSSNVQTERHIFWIFFTLLLHKILCIYAWKRFFEVTNKLFFASFNSIRFSFCQHAYH